MTSSGIEDVNKILSTGITIFPPSRRIMILSFSCSTLYINFSVNGKVEDSTISRESPVFNTTLFNI